MTELGTTDGQPLMIEEIARYATRADELYSRASKALNYIGLYSLQGSTEYGMLLQDLGSRMTYASTLRYATDSYLKGDQSRDNYDRILYFYSAYTASIELGLKGCTD